MRLCGWYPPIDVCVYVCVPFISRSFSGKRRNTSGRRRKITDQSKSNVHGLLTEYVDGCLGFRTHSCIIARAHSFSSSRMMFGCVNKCVWRVCLRACMNKEFYNGTQSIFALLCSLRQQQKRKKHKYIWYCCNMRHCNYRVWIIFILKQKLLYFFSRIESTSYRYHLCLHSN